MGSCTDQIGRTLLERNPMQLPAPARDCSDAEIDAVIDYWDMRRQPQPIMEMEHMKQWSECCPYDDEPEKRPHFVERLIRDRPGILGGAALGICLFVALALVLL